MQVIHLEIRNCISKNFCSGHKDAQEENLPPALMHSLGVTEEGEALAPTPFFQTGSVRTATLSLKSATVMWCLLTKSPAITNPVTIRG